MPELVKLIGLDFGTTTSSAVIAAALLRRTATGRVDLDEQEEIFRSEMVFTPIDANDRLDVEAVERLLDGWLRAGKVQARELFGGGALLTGLTAQKDNAAALVRLIRSRLGDALIATADDPCLESWLAFMGSCADLSRRHPEAFVLNLDIGGGTTNIALGRDRQVSRTGCLFVGARHVQVVPGTYRIVKLSTYARELFVHLGIGKGPGDDLSAADVDAFLTLNVRLLEAVCSGDRTLLEIPAVQRLEQVRFDMAMDILDSAVTFSGGVGELIYRHLQGEPWPATTHYGDLGIDLAQRIAAAPVWAESLRRFRPGSGGRATVYGLLRHATEVSGSTLFLGSPHLLPLADMPILGALTAQSSDAHIHDVLLLIQQSSRGGCVQIRIGSKEAVVVAEFGRRIARILQQIAFPATHPLVLLVEENLGKVLGQYVTCWGKLPLKVLVIDEVPARDAQYVQIGTLRDQVVPVSFHGFRPAGETP
ncbi:MAG: ethanolamine ammonia-lyase reactivating factor EutA [Planctomycetes bacterium]|nr:ethanolamine ammonia-lyase reactivating factor EutA [Planctomycetota bacterium]